MRVYFEVSGGTVIGDTRKMLTAVAIKAAKGRDKPFKLKYGLGLYLFVTPSGAKYWRLNYRHREKHKTLALGGWHPDAIERQLAHAETNSVRRA